MGHENIPNQKLILSQNKFDVLQDNFINALHAEQLLKKTDNSKDIKLLKKISASKNKSVLLACSEAINENIPIPEWAGIELNKIIKGFFANKGSITLDDLLGLNKYNFIDNSYLTYGALAFELIDIHDFKFKNASKLIMYEAMWAYDTDDESDYIGEDILRLSHRAFKNKLYFFKHSHGYADLFLTPFRVFPEFRHALWNACREKYDNLEKLVSDYHFRKQFIDFRFNLYKSSENSSAGFNDSFRETLFVKSLQFVVASANQKFGTTL